MAGGVLDPLSSASLSSFMGYHNVRCPIVPHTVEGLNAAAQIKSRGEYMRLFVIKYQEADCQTEYAIKATVILVLGLAATIFTMITITMAPVSIALMTALSIVAGLIGGSASIGGTAYYAILAEKVVNYLTSTESNGFTEMFNAYFDAYSITDLGRQDIDLGASVVMGPKDGETRGGDYYQHLQGPLAQPPSYPTVTKPKATAASSADTSMAASMSMNQSVIKQQRSGSDRHGLGLRSDSEGSFPDYDAGDPSSMVPNGADDSDLGQLNLGTQ